MKAGILSLGTRGDATTFEKGCKSLGLDVPLPIKKSSPTLEDLKKFFKRNVDWLFFAGHSGGDNILNEADTVVITFKSNKVVIKAEEETVTLNKNTADFTLDKQVKLILFGGCSMLSDRVDMEIYRNLFNNCSIIGFKQMTGWKMVNAMLGGGFIKEHFFKRAKDKIDSADTLAKIWLQTAASKQAYGNTDNEARFASLDSNGKRWVIQGGKIVNDLSI